MRKVLAPILFVITACSTKKQPPVATHSPLADSADQVMYGASFMLTDKGLSRAQMQGDTLYFFEDNSRIESENPHITFFTATGAKDAVLTARHGTSNTRTNNMVARGDVVVVSEDGRRLTTPELMFNQQTNQISSDSAFVLTEPDRRLEGIGFRSDPNMKNIQILKGVSGIARGVSTQTPTVLPAPANRAPIVLPAPANRPPTVPPAAANPAPTASSTPPAKR
jgi:LPS export ABC transporter protein LptC